MSDKLKTVFALIFFIAALSFPWVGFAYGYWRWDLQTGFLLMVGVFAALFAVGALLLWRVRDLSWLTASLPFVFGSLYTLTPDIPFQIDDAAATAAGALFSYALTLRKNAQTPKWIIVPLLLAAVYTLFGGPIPGPFDEVAVDAVALLISWLGARAAESENSEPE